MFSNAIDICSSFAIYAIIDSICFARPFEVCWNMLADTLLWLSLEHQSVIVRASRIRATLGHRTISIFPMTNIRSMCVINCIIKYLVHFPNIFCNFRCDVMQCEQYSMWTFRFTSFVYTFINIFLVSITKTKSFKWITQNGRTTFVRYFDFLGTPNSLQIVVISTIGWKNYFFDKLIFKNASQIGLIFNGFSINFRH